MDNRGRVVFVTLTWPTEVERGTKVHVNSRVIDDLYEEVSMVAIKNGHHDTTGYVLDTGRTPKKTRTGMPLRELYGWLAEGSETA